jgi:hypothetical protein
VNEKTCTKCGETFPATAEYFHLRRDRGTYRNQCKKCSTLSTEEKEIAQEENRFTRQETFIEKANMVHNNFYDYSEVEYIKNSKPVKIICPKHGPFFKTPAAHTSKKQGCHECFKERQSDSVEFVKQELKNRGGILVDSMNGGKSYIQTEHRIKVQCESCEKTWTPKWRTIKVNNRWCGMCSRTHSSETSIGLERLLEKQVEIIKLPENPIDVVWNEDYVTYKCKKCDTIETKKLRLIKRKLRAENSSGVICNNCFSFKNSRSQTDVKEIIEGAGYTLVDLPNNGKIKKVKSDDYIIVKCDHGHQPYRVKLSNFLSGKRCPTCGTGRLKEAILREALEEFFQVPFPSCYPKWLKNHKTGGQLEIDCYNEDLGLAVEFQGAQHYKPIDYWGGQITYEKVIERDKIKCFLIQQRGLIYWTFNATKFSNHRSGAEVLKQEFINAIRKKIECPISTPKWNKNYKKIRRIM